MRLLTVVGVLLAWAWAAPLLLQRDESERLSGSFLASPFCKQYGCVFKQALGNHRVYRAGKATIQVETLGAGNLAILELFLPHPKQPLSPSNLKFLTDFTRSATEIRPNFDFQKHCTQLAENPGESALQPQHILTFSLKGRRVQMWCLWDSGFYRSANRVPAQIRLGIGWMF